MGNLMKKLNTWGQEKFDFKWPTIPDIPTAQAILQKIMPNKDDYIWNFLPDALYKATWYVKPPPFKKGA